MTDFSTLGFVRVAACAPLLALGDPHANAREIARRVATIDADLVLLPELALTGMTADDLLLTQSLLAAVPPALASLAAITAERAQTLVVGAPWLAADGRLFNCAFVLARGRVCGAVPKTHLPNYGEFHDRRWFASGGGVVLAVDDPALGRFRIDARQLFSLGATRFGIEICEDLWAPLPTGVEHALAGAELIVNPSASPELVGKADYRRDLVRMASAQRICAYLYASSGPGESSKDVVFGGHLLAAENGVLLGESERFRFDTDALVVDVDWQKLRRERARNATFASSPRPVGYVHADAGTVNARATLLQAPAARPFVPADDDEFASRAREILAIQATGLARRILALPRPDLVIGISGGLDSTLAFLVALDALVTRGAGRSHLHAVTLPGPATSAQTLANARALAQAAGVSVREINISNAVRQHLADIGHDGKTHDVTFENAQARERTQVLFDLANALGGIVVGTGDLSELALGWCTYNGDHMASYNVNAGVPKTLIAYLVRWFGVHRAPPPLAAVLESVLATPISPELVPGSGDGVSQHTESIIGPYVLHDFFLYHLLRHGFGARKILELAVLAFAGQFERAVIRQWLGVFATRFYSQQFKRTTLPAGPKVGSVSLSPRGDWRMPDESTAAAFLRELDDGN